MEEQKFRAAQRYQNIERGSALKIPFIMYLETQGRDPFDLSGWTLFFTMKYSSWDNDNYDHRAAISKTFYKVPPQPPFIVDPDTGDEIPNPDYDPSDLVNRMFIELDNVDTQIPVGSYYFDIEIACLDETSPMYSRPFRVATFETNVIGGPTNRTAISKTVINSPIPIPVTGGFASTKIGTPIAVTFIDAQPIQVLLPLGRADECVMIYGDQIIDGEKEFLKFPIFPLSEKVVEKDPTDQKDRTTPATRADILATVQDEIVSSILSPTDLSGKIGYYYQQHNFSKGNILVDSNTSAIVPATGDGTQLCRGSLIFITTNGFIFVFSIQATYQDATNKIMLFGNGELPSLSGSIVACSLEGGNLRIWNKQNTSISTQLITGTVFKAVLTYRI